MESNKNQQTLSIADRIIIAVQGTAIEGYGMTVSIGVTYCGEEHVRNYEKVIDRADKAVYAAKNGGKNKVCIQ